MTVSFTVIGEPQPGGSKKGFVNHRTGRVVVVDANPRAKSWQWVVASAAVDHCPDGVLLEGPLRVVMRFYRLRPQGHYRANGLLRNGAPARPTTRPDVEKITRSTTDALTGVIWRDDSQIVDLAVSKHYGHPARVEVLVEAAESPAVPVPEPCDQLILAA